MIEVNDCGAQGGVGTCLKATGAICNDGQKDHIDYVYEPEEDQ
jgi:hypothetical protein